MSRIEQMGEILSELERDHPMLPLKAAFAYAEAIMDGRPIPIPDPADPRAVAEWAMAMPEPMEYVREGSEVHFINALRGAGKDWGVHIELKVCRMAFILLQPDDAGGHGVCEKNARCHEGKGHAGACRFTMSDHVSGVRSGATSRGGPRTPGPGSEGRR